MKFEFGKRLKISIFGQSHEKEIGVIIRGLPTGEPIDLHEVSEFMRRRSPGKSLLLSDRNEPDEPKVKSGLEQGKTTGDPLEIVIYNKDARPEEYSHMKHVPRPSHADYPAMIKYGEAYNTGGGFFSGRMTAPLCLAGAVCKQILARRGIETAAHLFSVGRIKDTPLDSVNVDMKLLKLAAGNEIPVLDESAAEEMKQAVFNAKSNGDSLGGIVECAVTGLPVGAGGALFEGLESRLSAAVFAIPAVKGIEFGIGFSAARMCASRNNDAFYMDESGQVKTKTNRHGGILGGMASGMPVIFRTAFKPTPSISKVQKSVDLSRMENVSLKIEGRHDPCLAIRAVPCVEAAAAVALLDVLLEADYLKVSNSVSNFRTEIDRVDDEMVSLLERRLELARTLGGVKKKEGLPVFDPEREQEVLKRLTKGRDSSQSKLINECYASIFEINKELQSKADL